MTFEFAKKLIAAGAKCYLYGGALRDSLLSVYPADYDFVVKGLSINEVFSICTEFGTPVYHRYMPGSIRLHTTDFGIIDICYPKYIVSKEGILCDRDATIEQHIECMDFTINGIAKDLQTLQMYTVKTALDDLKSRTLVLNYGYETLVWSPMIIVRAARFMSSLGFSLEERTFQKFNQEKYVMFDLVPEYRIAYEFYRFLLSHNTQVGEAMLRRLGIYDKLMEIYDRESKKAASKA